MKIFNNKNILITGGLGFIGSNIAKYFIGNTNNVKIIIIDKDEDLSLYNKDELNYLTIIKQNINNVNLEKIVEDNDIKYIFHMAGNVDTTITDKDYMFENNSKSFDDLINISVLKDIPLVYASSCTVYGKTNEISIVGKNEVPTTCYGESKLLMDEKTREFMKKYKNLKVIGLRYFNVYGPGESKKGRTASMILQINNKIKNNINPVLFKYGEQSRDFVYIDDIVQATIKASISEQSGIFNIGYGISRTFNDVFNIIKKKLNSDINIEYIDNPHDFYQNFTRANILNTIDYEPKVSLEEGINKYLDIINI